MEAKFVICIKNEGYEASLEKGKVYRVLDDEKSSRHHFIRLIDESGEDYLFPEEFFIPIKLPKAVQKALIS